MKEKIIFLLIVIFIQSNYSVAQNNLKIEAVSDLAIYGAEEQDNLGEYLCKAGDINNDGIEDFLLGVKSDFTTEYNNCAYIIWGASYYPHSIDLLNSTSGLTRICNIEGTATVSNLGDFNADGFDDFIVGNIQSSPDDILFAGDARIIFGTEELPVNLDYTDLRISNIYVKGYRSRAALGYSVSYVGDVNNDGFNDALISSPGRTSSQPGEVFLIYGGTDVPSLLQTPNIEPHGVRFEGAIPEDFLGIEVAGVGDVNGDKLPDFLLATEIDLVNATDHFYLIYGSKDLPNTIIVNDLNEYGVDFYNLESIGTGRHISAVGDINQDGLKDFLTSASGKSINGSRVGAGILVFGRSDFPEKVDMNNLGNDGFYINGVFENQQPGSILGQIGDINFDGWTDIFIGTSSTLNTEAQYYLVFNSSYFFDGGEFSLSQIDKISIEYSEQGALPGYQAGNIGDINGDGYDDFAFGDWGASPFDRFSAGTVYVVFGRPGLFQSLLQKSDLNDDGVVDNKDLFLFGSQWQVEE